MSKFVDQKRRSFFRKRQKIHPLPSIIGSVRNSDHAKGAGGVFLHYEIFLDLLFAENLLLNYTILRLSSFLLKRSATRRRSFAAAALGAGYAVLYAVFARYLPGALLALVGIGITTGMVKSGCSSGMTLVYFTLTLIQSFVKESICLLVNGQSVYHTLDI